MRFIAVLAGGILLTVVLLDAFQTIILPRRPVGRFRITRLFYALTWRPWRAMASALRSRAQREQLYSIYGPLSLLLLFIFWALLLTTGFGLIFFGLRASFHDNLPHDYSAIARLRSCLYVSGTTIFTLGLGDVYPTGQMTRLLVVLEAGTGLGFVALVIGYVPVFYTAFSRREILVALLDARAGSPPTASELLLRHGFEDGPQVLRELLAEWERWCAELLETHVSYPLLCLYRSQHDNQSWLSAMVAVLDCCALVVTMLEGAETRQAQLTFAMGRHALVDLVHIFHLDPEVARIKEEPLSRLQPDELMRLCEVMDGTGFSPCEDFESKERLQAMRFLYEPHACALANFLKVSMPSWVPPLHTERKHDAWAVVAGLRSRQALADRLTSHVSTRATAVNLESHDEAPEE